MDAHELRGFQAFGDLLERHAHPVALGGRMEPSAPAVRVPPKRRRANKRRERHGRDSMLARRKRSSVQQNTRRRPFTRRTDTVRRLDRAILFFIGVAAPALRVSSTVAFFEDES
jgi:hypothetical protein